MWIHIYIYIYNIYIYIHSICIVLCLYLHNSTSAICKNSNCQHTPGAGLLRPLSSTRSSRRACWRASINEKPGKPYGHFCKGILHITCETCELTISYMFFCQSLSICCGMSRWEPFKFCCSPHCVAMPSSWKVHWRVHSRGTAPWAPQKTSHRTSKAKAKQEARNQDNTSSFYFCCRTILCFTPKISPKIIEGRWRWLPLCVSRCCPSRIIIITSCNQWVSANMVCTSTRRTVAKPSYVRQAAVSHGSCPAQAL